jgi:hypothetical protein
MTVTGIITAIVVGLILGLLGQIVLAAIGVTLAANMYGRRSVTR